MDEISELKKRINDVVQRYLKTEQLVYHLEARLTEIESRIKRENENG